MTTPRILLALAWLASLAIAFVIGGSGDSAGTAAAAANHAGTTAHAAPAASAVASSRTPAMESRSDEAKPNVKLVIGRARLEMGSGMGGMMNIRGMLRAIAPIAELDDSQLQEALAEVEQTVREPQQKMMFYSLLLGQWAETDGLAAMTYAQTKLEKGSMFDMGVTSSVLSTWARTQPEEAWKWFTAGQAEDTNDRTRMSSLRSIFAGLAASDLDTAFARAGTLDEQSRGMALNGIASSATDDNSRRRVLDRVNSLPPEQRNQVRQNIAGPWAMSDPEAAVTWIRGLPADEQKPVRESAGQMMLMMKSALGAEFLLEGAEEKDKPGLYDRVASQWAQQDARAAGAWLTKQPQGPELDSARRSFARVVAQRDPAAAFDWARSVQDAKQRTESIGQVYQTWRGKDAAAADAALGSSGLPPEQVQKLREAKPPESTRPAGAARSYGY